MLKSKILKFSAFSLAAIALAFNFASCDVGNGEYAEERPTTWTDLKADISESTCTANWTFAEDKAGIGSAEVSIEGKTIAPDEGEGATLKGANGLGVKFSGGLQGSRKSASLENPTEGPYLKLTLDSPSNITVKAVGAGAADLSRILLVTDADGKKLVYKENLSTATALTYHVKGAPAGDYFIYFNGSKITGINASAKQDEIPEPSAYTDDSWENSVVISADKNEPYMAITQKPQITLKNGEDDVTSFAVWTVLSGAEIATIDNTGLISAKSAASEGLVRVRGRIGRFYKETEVTFVKNEDLLSVDTFVTTVVSSNLKKDTKFLDFNLEKDGKETDIAKVLKTNVTGEALVTAENATIEIGDVLKNLFIGEADPANPNSKIYYEHIYNTETNVYVKADDKSPAGGDEIWQIKDPTAINGGLHVKGLATAVDKVDVNNNVHFYTLKLKVTPAAGKSLKVTGAMACFNAGKGANNMKCEVIVAEEVIGTIMSTKNATDPSPAIFSSPYTLTGETEFIFKVSTNSNRSGQSVQLKDLSLLISE